LQPPTGGQGQPESIQQQVMGLGGQTVTFSIWMESNTSSNQSVQLTVTDEYGTPWGNTGCFAAPGAWQRCSATASIPASSQSQWASLTVNPQADVSLWGAQLEVASSAGGYVPTAGSPVTGNVFLTAFSASGLTGGENLITAAYGGDNNNTASTSTALSQNVNLVQITTPLPLLNGLINTPYSVTLSAAGGLPPYTWQPIGSLPQGLSLDSSGVISGTPTMATGLLGSNFAVQVTDSSTAANVATQQMNIQILGPVLCPSASFGCPTAQLLGVYPNQCVAGTNGLTMTAYGCFNVGLSIPTVNPLPTGFTKTSETVNGNVTVTCPPFLVHG
jgi:hypothetical protein